MAKYGYLKSPKSNFIKESIRSNCTMMREIYSNLSHLLLCTCGISDISLCSGKFGYAIAFYDFSRKIINDFPYNYADILLEDSLQSIPSDIPYGFSSGISGIGWGIEYLISEGFITDASDDLFEDIDHRIESISISRINDISWENGLYGIVLYALIRIKSNFHKGRRSTFSVSFLNEIMALSAKDEIINGLWALEYDALIQKGYELYRKTIKRVQPMLDYGYSSMNLANKIPEVVSGLSIRTPLYIFTENCKGAQYGVGTYLHNLLDIKYLYDDYNIVIVHLRTDVNKYKLEKIDGTSHIFIPDLSTLNIYYSNTSQHQYSQVVSACLKGYNDCFNGGQMAICHTNFFGWNELIKTLKELIPSKIVHTLHYTEWSFETLGDKYELKQALYHGKSNKIRLSFQREKEYLDDICDKIVVTSNHSTNTLNKIYEIPYSKIELISNPFDPITSTVIDKFLLRTSLGIPAEAKLVLFVGRLDPVKGLDFLLDAIRPIIEKDKSVILAIAGSGDFQKYIKLAKPYLQNILFLGFLCKKELYEWICASDIGVVPSLHEEFGYVALEMIINGLPIIVNDTTGLKELTEYGKYGTLVDIKDKVQTTNTILQNLCHSHRLSGTERQIVSSKYGKDVFSKKISALYKCLIG